MTPAVADAILGFAKGSAPPLKEDGESSDDFQTRTIEWLKVELKSLRVLVWALIAFHALMYGDMKGLV